MTNKKHNSDQAKNAKSVDYLYPLRIVNQVIRLPKIVHRQSTVAFRLDKISSDLDAISKSVEAHSTLISDINHLINVIDNKVSTIKHTASMNEMAAQKQPINNTVSDNHNLDYFYKLFEDKFRGAEEDIKKRVSEYKHLFDALPQNLKQLPVIDLGCGRGEFLSFAKDNHIKAIGVDMNHDMVERSNSLGFEVYENDAMSYIVDQKNNSISAITGFHIVEHIPFEQLMQLFEECYRVLSPGGFVLFETPNPGNIIVGACNFYTDPSHINPIPPDLLAFALESVGFRPEIIPTHPTMEVIEHNDPIVKDMMNMFYGPRDYAVFAKKI